LLSVLGLEKMITPLPLEIVVPLTVLSSLSNPPLDTTVPLATTPGRTYS